MQQLILNVEDSRLSVFVDFLRTLSYVQLVHKPTLLPQWDQVPITEAASEPYFLADSIGVMAGPDGDEFAKIMETEFQEIEGEW